MRMPLDKGILLTVVSLDPGVVNGYRQEFIPCLPRAPKFQVARAWPG